MELLQDPVPIGTRFHIISGHLGTIKYVGPVDGTSGVWYGVEWDDPNRGKHDGAKDGRRYFTCLVPGAGSFIRPSKSLNFGVTFLTALSTKYVDEAHSVSGGEKIILGSSNGAIEVEAVGFDKVRSKLRDLERLREVSLDNEKVAFMDTPGQIRRTCPNVRGLDLSTNLLPSWQIVAGVTVELPCLERLILNQNRFLPLDRELPVTAFEHLLELQLNDTLITWAEFREVVYFMSALQVVELGYNRLTSLSAKSPKPVPRIHDLNVEINELNDWASVASSLLEFVALRRLVLSRNGIRTIPSLGPGRSPLRSIHSLALSANRLNDWQDLDRLAQWCPGLESLNLAGNPLTENGELARHSRQFAIARIPTLLALDGTAISARERTDSELFYLSFVSKNFSGSQEEICYAHPQWTALCNKHGKPSEGLPRRGGDTKLSKSLINVNVYQCITPLDKEQRHTSKATRVKTLPTTKIAIFKLQVMKALKLPRSVSRDVVEIWLCMEDGFVKLCDDSHDLGWYGIEGGSDVFVTVNCTEQ
ncbi:hypothetical protein EDC04DRAFT_3053971 [Pisolithus marmoratus]|nr:hypothetical protein EDC04DRAFT_3053971 [Pisolithus marmoratus]